MTTVEISAPAKVFLSLHVTGQRSDGFHLLDGLVVFADIGDELSLTDTGHRSLRVTGPQAAGVPPGAENPVMAVASEFWRDGPLEIRLDRHLPPAAGLGSGSADAAACYRGITRLIADRTKTPVESVANIEATMRLSRLGPDHVMSVLSLPVRAQGIGEVLSPLSNTPALPAVLVNPPAPLRTDRLFKQLASFENPPMPDTVPTFAAPKDVADWLATLRNDLQAPAMAIAPQIATVLAALSASDNVMLARMSWSGATCFGLFPTLASARRAAAEISKVYPDWWVKACTLGDQSAKVAPRVTQK